MNSSHVKVSTSEPAMWRPAAVNFSEFLHKETSIVVFTVINIVNSLFGLIQFASYLVFGVNVLFLVPAMLRLLLIIPLNVYQYRLKNTDTVDYRISNMWLGDAIVLLFAIANGLNILVFAYPGDCDSPLCPDYTNELPTGSLIGYFMQLLCMIFVIKCHHSWTAWIAICCQAAFTIVLALRMHGDPSFFIALCLTLIFEGLVVFDFKRYLHRSFVTMIEIEVTVRAQVQAEQNRKVEETKSAEMRYLFGSVAHDLKTPLQSFSLELETLQHITKESINKPTGESSSEKLSKITLQINESVNFLDNVCTYMLMTINRAIDHAKTTSGIPLVPKFELMSLSQSLHWACKRIGKAELSPVVVSPVPRDIADTIITDQQWFRENLLCLVSNAHKYSSSGVVQVCCSLVTPSALKCDDSAISSNHHNFNRGASSTEEIMSEYSTVKSLRGVGIFIEGEMSQSFRSSHVTDLVAGPKHEFEVEIPRVTKSPSTLFQNSPPSVSCEKLLLIEVEDCGEGIPSDKRLSLFKPFQQAQRGAGGTGLGLYSLSNRVAALGGMCGVSDRKNGETGSRFWFAFPYFPSEASNLPQSTQGMRSLPDRRLIDDSFDEEEELSLHNAITNPVSCVTLSGVEGDQNKCVAYDRLSALAWPADLPSRVLLVEDSLMIQKATVRAFQLKNIEIDVAINGVEGLLKLKSKAYSLVLMDIQMPAMDGLDAVKHIRELKYDTNLVTNVTGRNVIVIGVSASSDSESEKEALDAGMNGYFAKPLSYDKLQDCLEILMCPLVPSDVTEVQTF